MNQLLGTVKQVGATIIIGVIIVMMGITFSSQPKHEILEILAGGPRYGEFRGSEIRPDLYHFAAEQCKQRFQAYGNVPDFFLQQCITGNLKQLVILPAISVDSGLDVSEKSVHDALVEEIRMQEQMQNQSRLPEDRISAEQLYRLSLARMPMDLRLRLHRLEQFQKAFGGPFPVSGEETAALTRAAASRLEMEVVAFSNAEALGRFKAEATEEEMRALYDADKKEAETQAKKEGVKRSYPEFAQRREFLKERVITEKKKKQLDELKTSLGALKGDAALEKVAEAVHARPERVQIRLSELGQMPLSAGRKINLTGSSLLADLVNREGLKGPYQDGETTVYLRVVRVEPAPAGQAADGRRRPDERSMQLAEAMYTNMVEEHAKLGKFRLKSGENPAQKSEP